MWKRKKTSEIEYFSDVRLSERPVKLFGEGEATPNLLKDVPATFKKESMFTYHLVPRLSHFDDFEILRAFGNAFTLVYEKPVASNSIHLYAVTPLSKTALEPYFEVSVGFASTYPYVAELRPTRWWLEDDFVFRDLPAAAASLPSGSAIAYSLVYDKFVERRVKEKKAKTEKGLFDFRRGERLPPAGVNVVIRWARDRIFTVKILAAAAVEERLKEVLALLEYYLPKFGKVRRKVEGEEKYHSLFIPKKLGFTGKLFSFRHMTATEEALEKAKFFPEPGKHPVSFHRGTKFRGKVRKKEGFSIGVVENEEFYLSPEDFFRHAYVVGQTGSGKTNLLKLLAKKLHESGHCVIVIDPHGDMAEELAITTRDAVFLHPTMSPFGLNPLRLPESNDRDLAITKSIDVLMNLFTNIFHLPETAINVRYILQTVTRQIYKLGAEPTLAGIYKIVSDIYVGADVGISDSEFREHERLLKNMPDQSFISTLGRLQSFAADKTLRRMTNTTTINIERFIEEKKMVLFSIPQAELGFVNTTLLCSTLLLHIYYTMLQLSKKSQDQHVFVIVDEFQNLQSLPILTQILSEARKFGLHLILAHQYVEQLSDEVFQAAINNAGIKFVFQVTGDVDKFRVLDPAFKDDILKTIVALPTGQCVVKMTTSPEEAKNPPFILNVRIFDYPPVRHLEDACTDTYTPPDIEISLELINPIFKYIDVPFPPKQKILYGLYKEGGEAYAQVISGHVPHINDHAFGRILNRLVAEGYLLLEKKKDGRFLKLTDRFFEDFEKIAPSKDGKELARVAALYYLEKGYYVAPTKSVPKKKIPRPDFVLIPYEGQYLDYTRTIDVEIEASPHKNTKVQLIKTFSKDTPSPERHVWCKEEHAEVVLEFVKYANKPTKVFVLTSKGVKVHDFTKGVRAVQPATPTSAKSAAPASTTPAAPPTPKQPSHAYPAADTLSAPQTPPAPVQASPSQEVVEAPQELANTADDMSYQPNIESEEVAFGEADSIADMEGTEHATAPETAPTAEAAEDEDENDRLSSIFKTVESSKILQVGFPHSEEEIEETDTTETTPLNPSPKVKPKFVRRQPREELAIAKVMREYRDILKPILMDREAMTLITHLINKAAIPDDGIPEFLEIAKKHLTLLKEHAKIAKKNPRVVVELLYEQEYGKEETATAQSERAEEGEAEQFDETAPSPDDMRMPLEKYHDDTLTTPSSEPLVVESIETVSEEDKLPGVLPAETVVDDELNEGEFVPAGVLPPFQPLKERVQAPIITPAVEVEELAEVVRASKVVEETHENRPESGIDTPKLNFETPPKPEATDTLQGATTSKRKKRRKKLLHEIMSEELLKQKTLVFRGRVLSCTEHVFGKLKTALEFAERYGGTLYLTRKDWDEEKAYTIEDAPPGTYTLVVETGTEQKRFVVRLK